MHWLLDGCIRHSRNNIIAEITLIEVIVAFLHGKISLYTAIDSTGFIASLKQCMTFQYIISKLFQKSAKTQKRRCRLSILEFVYINVQI